MQEKNNMSGMPVEFKKCYKMWIKNINISKDVFNKQLKLTNMKQCWMTYNNPFDALLPGDFYKLKDKNEVELALLYWEQMEIYNKMNYWEKKMKHVYKITADNSYRRKITKGKKRRLENETCSICLENHCINDVVTTSCGHHFGKSCFEQIIEKCSQKNIPITCPLCRNDKIEYYRYCLHN